MTELERNPGAQQILRSFFSWTGGEEMSKYTNFWTWDVDKSFGMK